MVGGRLSKDYADAGRIILAVEVLSPSTARVDRHRKRLKYQSEGVAEYWIVDAGSRLVERWRPGDAEPEILTSTLVWQPPEMAERLTIDLVAYFAEVFYEVD